MIRHFSLFSGIESFKKALDNLKIDNELVGYSEFDKYASVALSAIHGVSEELNYGDITKIDETKVPDCDLITYGFPCQDISIAGLGKGIIEGETRSGLLYDALRIIKHKMPKYAIAENVKNLVGKRFKEDFEGLLAELESYGYNNYWKVLNAKDYGIPQNRERVFVVSIRKDIDKGYEFPKPYDGGLRLKDLLEDEVEEKYYIDNERANELIERLKDDKKGSYPNVEDGPKVTSALSSREHRGSGWNDVVGTLCARDYKDPKVVAEPIEKIVCEQRTDEGLRFFKGGVVGTLRTIDSCGDKRVLEPNELKLHTNLSGGKWDKIHESARRVYDEEGIAPTIPTCGGGNIEPKVQTNYKIRKLTPKECWRLMGFTDEDYFKARQALEDRFYNGRDRSNSQMYKMAGNSIV
ncbi:MAG TPA: DNA (cytosine-5-)-methyltransferase, partial [Tissierellaceae bacterium]|nr:DNA (cytosine-5-)-methyltransferase [Tissierellaceae bacterium]